MRGTGNSVRKLWPRRAAISGLFFLLGFCLAVWAVNIPAIQATVHASNALLGVLLLAMGAGSVAGMQIAGPFVDRVGSKRIIVWGAIILAVGISLPGFAAEPMGLGIGLFVYGLGNGVIEVSVNDQAVRLERVWRRPIMGSIHAFFSIGSAAGATIGALMANLGLSARWALGTGTVTAAILACCCIPLLSAGVTHKEVPATAIPENSTEGPRPRRVAALALLAFLMMLAEGTANDWSALQATERFEVSGGTAAVAYGVFAVAISVGRLLSDVVVHASSPKLVVRYGAVAAGMGLTVVVLSPDFWLTVAGWAVFGTGLSGMTPTIFSAAGNLGGANQGVVISRVVGSGFVGLLAGPAIIGWVAEYTGLTNALVLPLLFCVLTVWLAPNVESPRPNQTHEADATLSRVSAVTRSGEES
jgi:MFS family permease